MPTKKPRGQYHHGDLRAALLEVAPVVIAERGLHGLSLRECARRLGVSHAAPYRHFADKETLLTALAGEGFRRLVRAGREAMRGLADPRDRLRAYGLAYVRFALEHPEHHRVMFSCEDDGRIAPEDRAAGDEAFELLRETTEEATGLSGGAEMPATLSFWSLAHGLSMLLLDGRIPAEHTATPEAVEALAASVFDRWRG